MEEDKKVIEPNPNETLLQPEENKPMELDAGSEGIVVPTDVKEAVKEVHEEQGTE